MKTIIDFANKVKSLVDGRMSNIANVEKSPSTHPYTVGKQLIFNGLLCKATSAIAVGDTLAVGTNLALADNVVEQIYSLNQGLTNSLANLSHENLLDNPWFTVNQRGQASYSYSYNNYSYTVDRWRIGYGDIICDVTNNGITLSSSILGSNFVQFIEEDFYNKFIAGKDVTLSVLLTDGTIKSATGHAPVNTSGYQNAVLMYITNTCKATVVGKTGENEQLMIRFTEANSEPVSIRAVKLELGLVSTLSMDSAPNYQQELAKCQRYYEQNKWYSWCVQASLDGVISFMTSYPFLVEKRVDIITTNILKQNIGNGQLFDLTSSTTIPSNEVTISQPIAYNRRMENIRITHNSIIKGHTYYFSIGDNCIAFSADL